MQGGCGTGGPRGPEAVEAALAPLGAAVHRPAPGEWGLRVPCAGWPLFVGVALRGGLLRAQAEVVGPGALPAAWLLHRNRRDLALVRYASSAAGATWVHGDLPAAAVTPAAVDELLGRLVAAAEVARDRAGQPSSAAIVRSR
ncbi:hypothetical protein [Patulibacter sp. SYSU D01012]|uniref:hypothetical protein n=1 Tax=Patulibacter sp. SYSU D01012 TaxID=2817381 RepID=UPI001B301CAA|nr:hypothetical protein [Patulibacter sp. SYSU D01012]